MSGLFGGGTVSLTGDVNGPSGANIVSKLTGAAGIVAVGAALAFTPTASAAQTGNVRGGASFAIVGRNAPNTADQPMVKLDGAGTLIIGSTAASAAGVQILSPTFVQVVAPSSVAQAATHKQIDAASTFGVVVTPAAITSFRAAFAGTTGFAWQDSGSVTRASVELTHGMFTAGGGGTDAQVMIGPRVGGTTTPATYLLANGVSAAATNYAHEADTANLYHNTINGGGGHYFLFAGTQVGVFVATGGWLIASGASSPGWSMSQATAAATTAATFTGQAAKTGTNASGGAMTFAGGAGDSVAADGATNLGAVHGPLVLRGNLTITQRTSAANTSLDLAGIPPTRDMLLWTTAAQTVNLPAPRAGAFYIVSQLAYVGSGVTFHRNAAEKINGAAADFSSASNTVGIWFVFSDGTDWIIKGATA